MITILSPSKRLNYDKSPYPFEDIPAFSTRARDLVSILKNKSRKDIKSLMGVSEDLAQLTYDRYQSFDTSYTSDNAKPAILAFQGDVYQGLDAASLNKWDLNFAQKHVRILSGLYGLLRPMDAMQPYRLEMGTDLKNKKGKNLYAFWGDDITNEINTLLENQKDKTLVNLASNEYFSSINKNDIKGEILDVKFREWRNGKLTFISFNAKKARGLMTRYIIDNRIDRKVHLKGFNYENYSYDEERSSELEYHFIR